MRPYLFTNPVISLFISSVLAQDTAGTGAAGSGDSAGEAVGGNTGDGSSTGCKFAGVNIAGFDFGADVPGPVNGAEQMAHFVNDDKQNIFRLPVLWNYLTETSGGPLNVPKFAKYDQLMQACLKLGAYCILDVHSYARYSVDGTDGPVVGQGGPPIDDLVNLWTQLAKKYAGQQKVIMGIMNEPHDLDVNIWSKAVQACVTAIRNAGATEQMLLLPGSSWSSAGDFFGQAGGDLIIQVTNPGCISGDDACAFKNLIIDFHNYFAAVPGTESEECDNNGIANAWTPPLDRLRKAKRQALVTELGGGVAAPSCLKNVCAALDFLNQNSDVYLGWTAWAAGAFDTSYLMTLLDASGNDTPLMKQCFAAKSYGGGSPGTDIVPQTNPSVNPNAQSGTADEMNAGTSDLKNTTETTPESSSTLNSPDGSTEGQLPGVVQKLRAEPIESTAGGGQQPSQECKGTSRQRRRTVKGSRQSRVQNV